MSILPAAGRPRISRAELETLLQPMRVDTVKYPLVVVGLRGWFAAQGASNARGVYDDALCVYAPSLDLCAAFNGNTDPSVVRPGSGTGAGKGMAVLNPGLWPVYRFDVHGGTQSSYEALCQRAGPVTVTRDGTPPYADSGHFGINIHRGGNYVTSSLGCQTVPPTQWGEFYATAREAALKLFELEWRRRTVAYALLDVGAGNPFVQPGSVSEPSGATPAAAGTVSVSASGGLAQWTARNFAELLIRPTLQKLGFWSAAAEELLLGTALAESQLKWRRQHGNGPARGLFQMEPATHDDIWNNYLKYGSRQQIAAAVRMFCAGAAPAAPLLENNDAYACAMARVHYLRQPGALPAAGDRQGQAGYWKKYYNTAAGGGSVGHYLESWRAGMGSD
ncbi:MAG: hypothetical protein AB7O64_18950 [Methylibium sp.]